MAKGLKSREHDDKVVWSLLDTCRTRRRLTRNIDPRIMAAAASAAAAAAVAAVVAAAAAAAAATSGN